MRKLKVKIWAKLLIYNIEICRGLWNRRQGSLYDVIYVVNIQYFNLRI